MKEIKKPAFMEQAMNKQGHNLFLEMLLVFAVYFIGTMLSSVVQLPAMAVYLFQSKEYIQMLKGGGFDTEKMEQSSRDFLEMAMADYNQAFHTNYDTSGSGF